VWNGLPAVEGRRIGDRAVPVVRSGVTESIARADANAEPRAGIEPRSDVWRVAVPEAAIAGIPASPATVTVTTVSAPPSSGPPAAGACRRREAGQSQSPNQCRQQEKSFHDHRSLC